MGNFLRVLVIIFILTFLFFPNHSYAAVSTWQKSVSLTPKSTTDFSSDSFKQSLRNYASTGANYVTLIIPYYQSSQTSSDIKAGWNTPTNQSLRDAIRYAKFLNFKVALKPHHEISSGGWRGNIDPTNRATWFSTYGGILDNLSTISKEEGVAEIILGTELRKLASDTYNSSNTAYWNNLISRVKNIYSGKLSYSAQWSGGGSQDPLDEKQTIKFWNSLDYLGLSAYWPLAASDRNPSTQTILNAWSVIDRDIITPWSLKFNKPIVFTEVGYRSVSNSNADPWDYSRSGSVDTALQARLYEGLYSYWNTKSNFQGVHWWEWETGPNAGGTNNTKFTPQNKPAQQVMTNWNGGIAGPGPVPGITYTVQATNSPSQPSTNQTTTISVTVSSSDNVSNQLVNFEIYNSSGVRVFQKYYSSQNLIPAGTNYSFTWTPTTSGTYTVKVGIFSNNWSTLYYWNNRLLNINVSGTTTTTAFTSSVSSSPSSPNVNQNTTVTASITSSTNRSSLLVDLEIYNSSNSRVFQKYFSGQTFSANTAKTFSASWTPTVSGNYVTRIGVFSNGWSTLEYWNHNAGTLAVGNTTLAATTLTLIPLSTSTVTTSLTDSNNPDTVQKQENPQVVADPSPDKPIEKPKETQDITTIPEEKSDYKINILKPESTSVGHQKIEVWAEVDTLSIDKYDMFISVNNGKEEKMRGVPDKVQHKEKTIDISKLESLDKVTLTIKAIDKKSKKEIAKQTLVLNDTQ